jgi:stage II sporulation protein D
MKNQPLLSVGIMAEPCIEFELEATFSHAQTVLNPGSYFVEKSENNLILRGKDLTILSEKQIYLEPDLKSGSFLLKRVTFGIQFHWEQKEDQRFTGGLKFIHEDGKVRAVNLVPLEDYLKSVISSEMSATASPDLLKAHAVISRSWLLAQMEKNKQISITGNRYNPNQVSEDEIVRWYDREDHQFFDVCADDHCQRYQGITKILTAKATDAVEATTGEVLISGSEICDARFSKCCGGISESFENVWEPDPKPYLTAVSDQVPPGSLPQVDLRDEKEAREWINSTPDAFCNNSDPKVLHQILPDFDRKTIDFYRWKVEYNQEEISNLIKKRSGIDFGKILRLEPLQRGFSGRINKLRIVGTQKTLTVGKELEIRKWLSPSHLYSSAFFVEYENITDGIPEKIVLRGAGWGHGVGLCQIGAAVMGEMQFSYVEILNHYFIGATLTKLYDE